MERSLVQKQSFVERTLSPWAELIQPIRSVEDEKRWGYRTSVTLAAEWSGSHWLFGTKSLDEVIPIHQCPVHNPLVNSAIEVLSTHLPAYLAFPLAFVVFSKKQCVLIVKQKYSEKSICLSHDLAIKLKTIGIEGFWVHFNPSAGRRLFEKGGWELIFGKPRSNDMQGLVYGPTSFQQQIQELYTESLNQAESFLMPNELSSIIDLYCGTGTSLRQWRGRNIQTIGVESSGEAIECAAINAPGASLLRGSCRLRIPQLSHWILQQVFLSKTILLYANPPRTGIELEVIEWILRVAKPQRIAYLSCSPGTLGKNLSFLNKNYRVVSIQPFDFFPQTHHVECLALLEWR
jgi:tRNA/tmRNA/rRNA uracil-C5-methylase (TrmA/RlmC/RlmD family)